SGTVSDRGLGVRGAIVQALSAGLIVGVAVTDPNGQYTLWIPPGVTYDAQASAIGRNIATVSGVIGGATNVNLTLPQMGTIAGTVLNSSDQAVAAAQILVSGGGFSAAATTDANGRYSLIGVPDWSAYSVTVSASGFSPATQNGVPVAAPNTVS